MHAQGNSTKGILDWHLSVLGEVRLVCPSGPVRLEKKAFGLLAYLAVEGATPKSRLAGLFWSDSSEATARANLRQLLRRLKVATGDVLVSGADPLALAASVDADVSALRGVRRTELAARATELPLGRLLGQLAFDDTPLFDEWLHSARANVDAARRQAITTAIDEHERSGRLADALALAARAVQLEPRSEDAHRQRMRLLYAAGDRGEALAVFQRLRAMLERELGIEPSRATTELAREIARSVEQRGPRSAPSASVIPLSVLRPPELVGREEVWARMEAAWAAGQAIIIGGPPGIGKSRLMHDFLHAVAKPFFFSGRPGDRAVPYGTHARVYSEMLAKIDAAKLAPWARAELARLVPALGQAPGPMESEADKIRMLQAKIEAHRLAAREGYDAFGVDDIQFVDAATAEAGQYVMAQLFQDPTVKLRAVLCYRAGELPEAIMASIREGVAFGLGIHIELDPLPPAGVRQLLGSLDVPGIADMADSITSYAGGNPLFVIETVKHVIASGTLSRADVARMPPGRIGVVLEGTLLRLSEPALQMARVLALLGSNFTLASASAALEASAAAAAACWAELTAAHVVHGMGFSHDLIGETVLATLPRPVEVLLRRRLAVALEALGADPALVAEQWRGAGEPCMVGRKLMDAATSSRGVFLPREAAVFYERAAEAFREGGDVVAANEVFKMRERLLQRAGAAVDPGA